MYSSTCRFIMATFIVIACWQTSVAQSNPNDKKLAKAREIAQKKTLEDADKYLEKELDKQPNWGEGWDLMAAIREAEYKQAKQYDGLLGDLKMVVKDSAGNEKPADDSLTLSITKVIQSISPSKKAYSKWMYTMRKATCLSREAYMSSAILRKENVDLEIDTNVNKKALKYFNEAETEFANKNYGTAAKLYRRACEEQPDFYKAHMYLGDCYYFTNSYNEAITSFKESKEKFPFLLEPRKYLTDAFGKISAYDKATEEAIASTTVYPDFSMFQKMEDAAYMDHRRLNIKWTPRPILPNRIEEDDTDINVYANPADTIASGPWVYYRAALANIKGFCNKSGVIEKVNANTESKYLEIYSWEEMLKNSVDPSLEEARKMQQQGYLDCYVLVTCFHYDIYDQYRDFVANNKDKVIKYYHTFLQSQ